ncbi:MAG: hypothetical protein K0R44_3187, partial [Thermomicrobiales bacterium]|nr:hypothetical protein [Thermomicrobiales bacterium]
MCEERIPPSEPITARMRIVHRGYWPTGRALNCGRCGHRLPTLIYLPLPTGYLREGQRKNGGLSPNDLYIDWRDMAGWRFDGATLRPTEEHREKRQRAREKVHANSRKETRPTRLKLAGRSTRGKGLTPSEERWRHG